MTRADNTRYLTQATAQRHQETLRKASDAIAHLDSSGQSVNFSVVAAAAGVSRASLYRDPGIRDLISRIRAAPSRPATTRAAQRATAESLRTRLNTARAEITRLRAENITLREQAARHLGEQRAANHHTHPPARRHPPGHAQNHTSATCLTRKTPVPPGLIPNGLKITAVMFAGAVLWDRSSGPRRTVFLVSDRHQIARQSKARPPYIPRYTLSKASWRPARTCRRGARAERLLWPAGHLPDSRRQAATWGCLAKRQIARPLEAEARACRVSTLELFLAQGLPQPRLVVVAELSLGRVQLASLGRRGCHQSGIEDVVSTRQLSCPPVVGVSVRTTP